MIEFSYKLLGLLVLLTALVYTIIRYTYLTNYSKVTKEKTEISEKKPIKKPTKVKTTLTLYDEFLKGIHIFGYLKQEILLHLTQDLKYKKFNEGDMIPLTDFSVVVQGIVQLYCKSAIDSDDVLLLGGERYQLLNEVKMGSSLTSLIATLDLINGTDTDSDPLSADTESSLVSGIANSLVEFTGKGSLNEFGERKNSLILSGKDPLSSESFASDNLNPAVSDVSENSLGLGRKNSVRFIAGLKGSPQGESGHLDLIESDKSTNGKLEYFYSNDATDQKKFNHNVSSPPDDNDVDPLAISSKNAFYNSSPSFNQSTLVSALSSYLSSNNSKNSLNSPMIIAKAKSPATIAIIPQSSFQTLQSKFPQATSHIVTMVLHRLHKVTISTVHNYLGLTKEIFESEIELNRNVKSLPNYLIGDIHSDDSDDIKVPKSRPPLNRNHSTKYFPESSKYMLELKSSRYVLLESKGKSTFSGDLLSSVPISRKTEYQRKNSIDSIHSTGNRDFSFANNVEETEEQTMRMAIVESVFSLIGLDDQNVNNPSLPSTPPESEKGDPTNDNISNDELKFLVKKSSYIRSNSIVKDLNYIKSEFANVVQKKFYTSNTEIVEQGSFTCGLYYVIEGNLDIIHERADENKKSLKVLTKMYSVGPGGLAGYLSSVLGSRSLVSIKTSSLGGAVIGHIPKGDFIKLIDRYYFLHLPLALRLKNLLSRQMLTIDHALEWCRIPSGEILCSQGDMANGFHVVLSGRFRVLRDLSEEKAQSDINDEETTLVDESTTYKPDKVNGNIEVVGEYGHGESIGEVEVLTASRRTTSLVAIRDSETSRIPRTLFELLSIQNPTIMVKVSRIVAKKAVLSTAHKLPNNRFSNTRATISGDYKTITILPTVSGLPVKEFAEKLVNALKTIGRKVTALDQASVLTQLGRHAFDDKLGQLKLSGYFSYLEEEYDTIVYVCDSSLKSNWTKVCISQGDCNLLLADAEDESVALGVGEYESLLIDVKTTARTDLILLHPDQTVLPGSTSIWLKNRPWVQGHHHITMVVPHVHIEKKVNKLKLKFKDLADKINKKSPFGTVKIGKLSQLIKMSRKFRKNDDINYTIQPHKNDFLRLARILSNEAVGLVLGGGGARGISHVGVVLALEAQGIPVDIIGGTSIGSLVGGLYAKDYNPVAIYGRAKQFSKRISALWRLALDLTYPVTSYITGYEFNRGIWKIFGNYEIEDFWLQYFCNSTNITNSTMDIHETGFSWRFIRASMSLAGLLPPIAYNGCMLLDGGYLDNLPVQEMKMKGAKYIIAVDVGSIDDRTPQNYGDTLSGFWVLFNRWNPFSEHPNVPNMMDIQMRLAYVASVNALEEVKKTPGVIYMRPPIDEYATLDFHKFDEIFEIGLKYAEDLLKKWEDQGKLPDVAGRLSKSNLKSVDQRMAPIRRNSI